MKDVIDVSGGWRIVVSSRVDGYIHMESHDDYAGTSVWVTLDEDEARELRRVLKQHIKELWS